MGCAVEIGVNFIQEPSSHLSSSHWGGRVGKTVIDCLDLPSLLLSTKRGQPLVLKRQILFSV